MSLKESLKEMKAFQPLYNVYKSVKKKLSPNQDQILDEVFAYYRNRFQTFSGAFADGLIKDETYLFWLSHVVEKGIAMPNRRLGFGTDKVMELTSKLNDFSSKYSVNNTAYNAGIAALREYHFIHEKERFQLSEEVEKAITPFLDESSVNSDREIYTPDTFYNNLDESFDVFSLSRHSVREFSIDQEVPVDELIECVKLAQSAPSACNRQHARVHIVSDKTMIMKCLSMQNGNRGFGNLANKLLIITGDLQTVLGSQEFFDLNTNVGIFIMNLSYALHYHRIAHCILNWYAMPKDDKVLRKYVGIPDQENIVSFIVCGKVPECFKVAVSPRKPVEQIITLH